MLPANKFLKLQVNQITPELEEEFFASLRLRNGTYKTTFQKRFSKINNELLKLLNNGDIQMSNLLDIGMSSGISTLELYDDLKSVGYKSRIAGTDFMMDAYLTHVFPGCYALMDNTGYPLRYDLLRWSIKPWVTSEDYWSGFFILRKCINLAFGNRAKNMICGNKFANLTKVKLITPRLYKHSNIVVQKDDITQYNHQFNEKFNFIRAANILNKGYFTEAVLVSIIGNIKRYLTRPTGALLVVRTHENGINHGSLFNIESAGTGKVIRRFGEGSEIEDIVLGCISKG